MPEQIIETIEKYNFDPVSLEIGSETLFFANYDIAIDFIREYGEELSSLLGETTFEEDQDYVIEDIEFYLSAQEALDAIFSNK